MPDEEDFEEGQCLISKVIFLPAFHKDDPARVEALEYFEVGEGRLHFQDWAQALLTTGTFLTLAILNTAYVSCVFPYYKPKDVVENTQGLASPSTPATPGLVGRKLLQESLPTWINPAVIRAIPTIVAFFVGGLLSFFRNPRHMSDVVCQVGYVPADQNPALLTRKQLKALLEERKKRETSGDATNSNNQEAADAIVSVELVPGTRAGPAGSGGSGGQAVADGGGSQPTTKGSSILPLPSGDPKVAATGGAPTSSSTSGVPAVEATGGSANLANTTSLPVHRTPSSSLSPRLPGSELPGTPSSPRPAPLPMPLPNSAGESAPPAAVGAVPGVGTEIVPAGARSVGVPSEGR